MNLKKEPKRGFHENEIFQRTESSTHSLQVTLGFQIHQFCFGFFIGVDSLFLELPNMLNRKIHMLCSTSTYKLEGPLNFEIVALEF